MFRIILLLLTIFSAIYTLNAAQPLDDTKEIVLTGFDLSIPDIVAMARGQVAVHIDEAAWKWGVTII